MSNFCCQIQSQGKTSPTAPPKPANKLDNMLGSLQSDLNRLGVQTVAKGVCGACKKPIVGQVMIILNQTSHSDSNKTTVSVCTEREHAYVYTFFVNISSQGIGAQVKHD